MTITRDTQRLLDRARELLPVNDDEIVQRGIAQATLDRIVTLRRRAAQLAGQYTSWDALAASVNAGSVTPDDHTLYTDYLEWGAVRHELTQLTGFLERI
jgi:hypothetical protein